MKKHLHSVALTATCGITLFSLSAAQAQMDRFYVRGDVGGALTQDADLKEFFGESLSPGSKVEFDPGFRFGMTAGYQVTDWFSGEAQTGIIANRIRSMTDASVDDASLSSVPFLINARFQCPAQLGLCPYAGGGLGVSATVLDADHIDLGETRMTGSQSTAVFAYQAFAGLRYQFNERMGVSVEYHYFGTTDPEWKADVTFGTGSDKVKFGAIQSHMISAAFEYHF